MLALFIALYICEPDLLVRPVVSVLFMLGQSHLPKPVYVCKQWQASLHIH